MDIGNRRHPASRRGNRYVEPERHIERQSNITAEHGEPVHIFRGAGEIMLRGRPQLPGCTGTIGRRRASAMPSGNVDLGVGRAAGQRAGDDRGNAPGAHRRDAKTGNQPTAEHGVGNDGDVGLAGGNPAHRRHLRRRRRALELPAPVIASRHRPGKVISRVTRGRVETAIPVRRVERERGPIDACGAGVRHAPSLLAGKFPVQAFLVGD